MLMDDLVINERRIDGITVVELEGDLDAFTVQEVRCRLNEMIEEGINRIVLNFSKLRYINSTSIGVLVGRLRRIRERGGDMVLAELNPRVNRIITLVGGRRLFRIFDTERRAIEELSNLTGKGEMSGKTEDD
ncbi:TPA: anti-sigma factor antagonist [Candidatus Poribacteria bacterium]|nr:anti-sigma factor antagonist [Candidatus Poribacteria bacterium]HEX30888.1 anti-sigma factor antagonist [Candidatus Poribacteria bacterium]